MKNGKTLPPLQRLKHSLWRKMARVVVFLSLSQVTADVEVGFLDSMTRPALEEKAELLSKIRIEAARGEWEPLQVVLSGKAGVLEGMRLEVEGPVNAEGEALVERVMHRGDFVRVPRSTEYAPLPPGYFVDPLVPIPEGRPLVGRRITGDDREINQPVWIDFWVPAGAKPGVYAGSVLLREEGGREVKRRLFEVEVWDFELPRRPSLKSSIGMDPRRVEAIHGYQMGTKKFNLLCRAYEDMLADHRLSAEVFWGTQEVYNTETGRASLERGGLPGLGTPLDVYRHFFEEKQLRNGSISFWPEWPLPDALGKDREKGLRLLASLMGEFAKHGWADRIEVHCGSIDEPDSREEYADVRRHGAFFKELEKRHGVRLPMYVTEQPAPESRLWGTLHGYVDIYVTHMGEVWEDMHGKKTRQVEARLKAGDEIWMYPAMVQVPESWLRQRGSPEVLWEGNPPAWILDFPPMNHRIFSWVAPLYGITGVLYWDTVEWREGIDPWDRADTFRIEDDVFNGDGLLLYPGFPERVGFEGPVASLRLKWIREAMEDHGYLTLLSERGEGDWAGEQIRRVCRGIGDWDGDPAKLFEVRRILAKRLAEGGN